MLRVLLASQPVRAGWLSGTTFSTVTHGALIAIAVVATNTTVSSVREHRAADAVERITVEPARLVDVLRAANATKAPRAKPQPAPVTPDFTAIANAIQRHDPGAGHTAAPDLTAVTDAWADKPVEFGSAPDGLAGSSSRNQDSSRHRTAFIRKTWSTTPSPRRNNPKPRSVVARRGRRRRGLIVAFRRRLHRCGARRQDRIPSTMALRRGGSHGTAQVAVFTGAGRRAVRRAAGGAGVPVHDRGSPAVAGMGGAL